MIHRRVILIPLLYSSLLLVSPTGAQSLRVVTLNVWTGLDYHGVISIGEYESPEQRERRFVSMLQGLRAEKPDVVALQEANPVYRVASRLADSLGYDVVWQRVNAGLKFGPIGIPCNLNEGLALLARKEFHIEFEDVWDLETSPGIFGNVFSLHAAEQNVALVARIQYRGTAVLLIDVHASATVPVDSSSTGALATILDNQGVSQEERTEYDSRFYRQSEGIGQQLDLLARYLAERTRGIPRIVLGDFNLESRSSFMTSFLSSTKLIAVPPFRDGRMAYTWDPERNPNTKYSRDSLDARRKKLEPLELLGAWYDGQPRTIDYILVDSLFAFGNSKESRVLFNSAEGDVYVSDHYGLCAEIPLTRLLTREGGLTDSVNSVEGSELEPLPILSYDTDVGFGYGVKVFYLNPLGTNESFDLVLFNSTKGERWYRFVYSVPDFEVRQGKIYPLALDFTADYDKYLKNSFFGVGNGSRYEDRETYTREPLELSLVVSRGFSTRVVGQIGLRYKVVTNFPLSDTSRLLLLSPGLNKATARYHSLFATYRYDSRNSFINPSRGIVLQAEAEYAPQSSLTNVSLGRVAGWFQYYSTLFYPRTVFALRVGVQGLIGDNVPIQVLLPIGGNQTVRGSPQDRYLDRNSAVMNAELRFPLFWRFGGVLGYDAGKVWHRPGDVDLGRWVTNPVTGLRFHMDTFVVRLDVGFGRETTGLYLNFGQLF